MQYFTAAPTWAGIYQIPKVAEITAADAAAAARSVLLELADGGELAPR